MFPRNGHHDRRRLSRTNRKLLKAALFFRFLQTFSPRVTDGLAVDDIAGTRAARLYEKPPRKTRLEVDKSPTVQSKRLARRCVTRGKVSD